MARKFAIYVACAAILAAFSPLLPFLYVAAAGVILAGLALLDVVRRGGRR